MGRTLKVTKLLNKRQNDTTFLMYYNRLVNYALNLFEWKNLPDTIDPRFLELSLMSRGFIVFFKHKQIGYLTLNAALGGLFNVYRIPKTRFIYTENGFHVKRNSMNSVIIWNNFTHTPTFNDLYDYADRLTRIVRTLDINVNALKQPIILYTDENTRFSLANLYEQYDGNKPFIVADKKLQDNPIEVINTKVDAHLQELVLYKHEVWNEAMTYLGLSNANTDKKERVNTNEVTSNEDQIEHARYNMLSARREACKEINRMFGLNIWCDFRQNDEGVADELDLAKKQELNEKSKEKEKGEENE